MRLTLLLFLASLTVSTVRADDAAKRAKIEELLTVTRLEQMMQQQQSQMPSMIHRMMDQAAPGMASNPAMEKVEQEIVSEAQAATRWDAMKPDFIKVYSETFSEDEITGLTAFYRSPLGQAVIEKMPAVMSKSMELVQAHLQTVMPRMQQRLQEILSTQGQPAK